MSTWYHVINRGTDRQDVFSGEADFGLFESLLAEAFDRHGVELHAYALMTNHFHLMVNAPSGELSSAMQRLCGRYGAAYNERSGRVGPVFTGRFRAVPILDDSQATQLGRYIHRNPIPLVGIEGVASYPWSSLCSLCGPRVPPDWLRTNIVTAGMSEQTYLTYVTTRQPSDKHGALAEWIPPPISEIESAVASVLRSSAPLRSSTRGRERSDRTLVATIATELRAMPTAELAERMGLADSASVRQLARRGRVRRKRDPSFARVHARVLRQLVTPGSGPGVTS